MIWVRLIYSLSNSEAIRAKTNLRMQSKGDGKAQECEGMGTLVRECEGMGTLVK
jgi:hypothetical protein